MLPAKAVAAFVFIWVVGVLLGCLFDMSYLGTSQSLDLNHILFYDVVTTQGTYGSTEIVASPTGYMQAIWRKATFQFSFFTAESELVRWLAFGALTAYFTFGISMTVLSLLRGVL